MRKRLTFPRFLILGALVNSGFLFPTSSLGGSTSAGRVQEQIDECLGCHSDPSMVVEFSDGSHLSATVDGDAFAKSVHGTKVACTGCHRLEQVIPHPPPAARNAGELRESLGNSCRHCHLENFTRTADGAHYAARERGQSGAPSCIDCHGAHEIEKPGKPRARVSKTCATCHSEVFEVYARSVHGKALLEDGNEDVPVCTDCHRSHDIADPKSRRWKLSTPEACGRCHADDSRMAKYGLSTKVLSTYLADFHGSSASLYRGQKDQGGLVVALCTDCHGVHDIRAISGTDPGILKANLLAACRKCHPDASANFPAAWLSHYEPSPKHAPLVWAARLFYAGLIPFMIGGLVLQILLHLWRVVVNK